MHSNIVSHCEMMKCEGWLAGLFIISHFPPFGKATYCIQKQCEVPVPEIFWSNPS